jgi:hypothetical protein
MTAITGPRTDRHENRAAARERRRATMARELGELLETRPELAEACPLADFAVHAVRWTV